MEAKFFKLFQKYRDDCREATLEEQFEHSDIICGDMKIDVKAMKRVHRSCKIQDEFTWIEFKNTAGREGKNLISIVRMQDILDLPHEFICSDEEII